MSLDFGDENGDDAGSKVKDVKGEDEIVNPDQNQIEAAGDNDSNAKDKDSKGKGDQGRGENEQGNSKPKD